MGPLTSPFPRRLRGVAWHTQIVGQDTTKSPRPWDWPTVSLEHFPRQWGAEP